MTLRAALLGTLVGVGALGAGASQSGAQTVYTCQIFADSVTRRDPAAAAAVPPSDAGWVTAADACSADFGARPITSVPEADRSYVLILSQSPVGPKAFQFESLLNRETAPVYSAILSVDDGKLISGLASYDDCSQCQIPYRPPQRPRPPWPRPPFYPVPLLGEQYLYLGEQGQFTGIP